MTGPTCGGGDGPLDFISTGSSVTLKFTTDTDGATGQGFQFKLESSELAEKNPDRREKENVENVLTFIFFRNS